MSCLVRVFGGVVLLFGLAFVWFGGRGLVFTFAVDPNIARAAGVVDRVDEDHEGSHLAQVRFVSDDGAEHTVYLACAPFDCFSHSSVGSSIPVVYLKSRPDAARPDTLLGRGVTPVFMVLFGLFMVAWGVGFLLKPRETQAL